MTGWKVVVTAVAERDLTDAMGYIRDQLGSPVAALRLLDEFEARVQALSNHPEAYPQVREARLSRFGYRWAPVGGYMAFFTTDRQSGTVTIERLLYGRSNWHAVL